MYMITMKQGEYKTETILIYNLFHMGFKNVVLLTGASGGGAYLVAINVCVRGDLPLTIYGHIEII